MASLARSIVEGARNERDQKVREANVLRDQLSEAKAHIESLRSELSVLNENLTQTSMALAEAKNRFDADRQHWGHDLAEVKAGQQTLFPDIRSCV